MNAEDFFPMGWLDKPFRRQPYPDMTYGEALNSAALIGWNIGSDDSFAVREALLLTHARMNMANTQFEGRSQQHVAELNELWRGKVTTLMKTSGGTK